MNYLLTFLLEKDSFDEDNYSNNDEFEFYNKIIMMKISTKKEGFSLIKPKIIQLIIQLYLNENNPLLSYIMQEYSKIIEYIKDE